MAEAEPEWMSTNRNDYWRHSCGELVKLRFGLPDSHTCPKPKKIEENARYGKEGMSSYSSQGKCLECGSTVHGPQRGQHSNFHANYIHRAEVKDGFAVSAVKWCDQGGHAFKANAPGSQSLDVVQRGEDGAEERVTMDMCAEHAFPTGAPTSPAAAREIEAAYNDAQIIQKKYEKLMKERLSTPMNAVSAYPHHNED